MPRPTRRQALAALAATSAAAAPASRLIADENAKPGTTDWQLTYVKFDAASKYRQSLIEGYGTRMSVKAGQEIGFCVSTVPAAA